MLKIVKICSVFIIFIYTSCSTSISNLFIDTISGTYNRFNSTDVITVDNFGSIYVNHVFYFRLYHVLSSNTAVYEVVNSTTNNEFVPVLYRTDILYVGQVSDNADDVDFSTVEFFGLKTS